MRQRRGIPCDPAARVNHCDYSCIRGGAWRSGATAGQFFNGVMGQFSAYNAFPGSDLTNRNSGGGGGYPAPGGPPPSNTATRRAPAEYGEGPR